MISKVAAPRVALLNMGHDAETGRRGAGARRTAACGRCAGSTSSATSRAHELTSGRADVVVCEGLLGNIVLKLLESVASMAVDLTTTAAERSWRWRAGMAIMASGADRLRALADYATYGGAPLLGFEHVFIKAHGRSRPAAIANAVKVAAKAVRDGAVQEIAAALQDVKQ